jgi:hypothetical protein
MRLGERYGEREREKEREREREKKTYWERDEVKERVER